MKKWAVGGGQWAVKRRAASGQQPAVSEERHGKPSDDEAKNREAGAGVLKSEDPMSSEAEHQGVAKTEAAVVSIGES